METLKIALASDWFYPKIGGIETHIHELALNLLRLGFEPHVITHDYRFYPKGAIYNGFKPPYPVHRIKGAIYIKSHHISVGPGSVARINELFKRYRFDLAHVHSIYSPFAMVAANVARGIRGVPALATNHSLFDWDNRLALRFLPLLRYSLKRVDAVIAVSSIVATDTLRVLGEKLAGIVPVYIVPNAVDTSFWRPPEPEEEKRARRLVGVNERDFVVFAAGRFTWRKRVHAAVKIAALAAAKNPRRTVSLIVVGDGPLSGIVERFLASYGSIGGKFKYKRLSFVERSKLRYYYWASNVVIVPGLLEAMPITALEAMACGRPVVGFKGTGLVDVIVNGYNGFLVSTDYEAAEALFNLASDGELLAKLSEKAAETISLKFDWKRVIGRIVDIYKSVVNAASEKDKLFPPYKLWVRMTGGAK